MGVMLATSRGLSLATLCLLASACPMPNPAWLDSTGTGDSSASGTGTVSAGSLTIGETTTGTTSAVTVTMTDATEQTASSGPGTASSSTTTDATGTTSTSDPTDTTDGSSSSTTGGPTCEAVVGPDNIEANALDLLLETYPWDLADPAVCAKAFQVWTGAPLFSQVLGDRFVLKTQDGCGDGKGVAIAANYPPGFLPNLNNGDCIRVRVFLAWNDEMTACSRLRGFEVERLDSTLLMAVAAGAEALSEGNSVIPHLKEGCVAEGACQGAPGTYELESTVAKVFAVEGQAQASQLWEFHNRRSHVHDAIDPESDGECLKHLDWILNRK